MINNSAINQGGQRSYSVSLIRLISLLMIITCHVFQYLGNELAWWFNVGVQIFLCISGYLYGQKATGDIKGFYGRRFAKILVPFFVVLVPALLLNLASGNVRLVQALSAFLMHSTISGGGHLWFVPTILICYVITPVLESFYQGLNRKQYIVTTIIAFEIVAVFFYGFTDFYSGAWIGCYIIGYALGVNEKEPLVSTTAIMVLFGTLTSLNLVQIYVDYYQTVSLFGSVGKLYNILCDYNHVWLGVFFFLVLKEIFDKIEFSKKLRRTLDITDKYSYETYLVHQFLVLGPFTLMSLTSNLAVNIFIILIGIGVLAWLVKRIEMVMMKALVSVPFGR